ncbi:hypothetical protein CEXT_302631 [Caerostris extrusa]|uniref:Uncharacterized protein n=1 Tax=Caerostris extrusa TaxID=172846 RepID=A0AAV4VGD1_CAEEX|nr:hypothetical protein CEXT_302631 [Caerostris extrusa]
MRQSVIDIPLIHTKGHLHFGFEDSLRVCETISVSRIQQETSLVWMPFGKSVHHGVRRKILIIDYVIGCHSIQLAGSRVEKIAKVENGQMSRVVTTIHHDISPRTQETTPNPCHYDRKKGRNSTDLVKMNIYNLRYFAEVTTC